MDFCEHTEDLYNMNKIKCYLQSIPVKRYKDYGNTKKPLDFLSEVGKIGISTRTVGVLIQQKRKYRRNEQ